MRTRILFYPKLNRVNLPAEVNAAYHTQRQFDSAAYRGLPNYLWSDCAVLPSV